MVAYNLNLNSSGPFRFRYSIGRDMVKNNYIGFFVQATLKMKSDVLNKNVNENQLFVISTDVNIIPEYYPVGDCVDLECLGTLV